jgi:flagellar hook-associated protein 2
MGLTSATGLISGINFNEAVSQLVQLEQRPIQLLQLRKAELETVSAELSTLSIRLSSLQTAATSLSSLSSFNSNSVSVTTSSSGFSLLEATADETAVPGLHQITVNQLAQAHSMATVGFVDQDTTPIADAAGTLKFKVGVSGAVTEVGVTADMTLIQLRDAINALDPGVKASIINDGSGSNPYRLVLTAKHTGAANTIIGIEDPTNLTFGNEVEAAFARTTNSYAGTVTSNEGSNYTGTTNKTFLVQIVTGGDPGTATYKYSIDGGITFLGSNGAAYNGTNAISTQTSLTNYIDGDVSSDAENEGVQISFGAASGTLVAGDQFTIDVFEPTLQEAQDAVIQVGNLTIAKDSNEISDVIQGVTLDLLKADSTETIDVAITEETTGIRELVDEFLSAYNDAISYLNDQLSFDPDLEEAKPLLGDTTATLLKRQLQNLITTIVPGSSSGLNSLAQLGISTDPDTAELSLDDTKFNSALAASIQDVTRLFVGIGVPSNTSIDFVSKTDNTNSGSYGININTVPTKATVQGEQIVPAIGITAQEIVSVSLFSNATSVGNLPTTAQVTLAAGSNVNDIVNALNSAFATKKMEVSASNNNGIVQITSTEYGDDFKMQVLSDKTNVSTQSGLGTADSSARESTGMDVAGTINGFKATGKGAVLTSGSGASDDGLSIRAEVTTTGNFGNIVVSSGIADRMVSLLEATVNNTTGNIKTRQDGIASSIETIDKDIERKALGVARFEQRTLEQFQRLEVLLGQFQIQGNALASSLAGLSNLSTQISNR